MALITQADIDSRGEHDRDWRDLAYQQLRVKLQQGAGFPCFFAQRAFKTGLVLYSFIDALDLSGLKKSVDDLSRFVALSRQWNGQVSTAQPLLMVIRPAKSLEQLEDYHAIGWRILQYWHDVDPAPWPPTVSRDTHSPFWTMCFDGMQLFINMSAPAHVIRRSRNLGDGLVLVINPRERFDIVAGETRHGRKIRAQIRSRVEHYDNYPHCSQLGSYQAGEIEWSQYGIIEQNRARSDRCPLWMRHAEGTPFSEKAEAEAISAEPKPDQLVG